MHALVNAIYLISASLDISLQKIKQYSKAFSQESLHLLMKNS